MKRYLVAALIGIGSLGLGGLGGLIAARHLGPGPFDWFAQLVLIGVGLAVGLLVGLVGVGLCLKQEECP